MLSTLTSDTPDGYAVAIYPIPAVREVWVYVTGTDRPDLPTVRKTLPAEVRALPLDHYLPGRDFYREDVWALNGEVPA